MEKIKAKITGKKIIEKGTVFFKLQPEKPISFKPGQFILIFRKLKGKEDKRAYSICSPPKSKTLEILTKIQVPGSFTENLQKAKIGDTIEISSAYGVFYFQEGIAKKVVLISAGCGISPLISMARYIDSNKLNVKVVIIYGCRTKEGLYFKKEIEKMANKNKNIKYFYTLSRPKDLKKWKGHIGRIDETCLKKYIGNPKDSVYYICGPPPMMESVVKILSKLGVKKENIKKEKFH